MDKSTGDAAGKSAGNQEAQKSFRENTGGDQMKAFFREENGMCVITFLGSEVKDDRIDALEIRCSTRALYEACNLYAASRKTEEITITPGMVGVSNTETK